VMAGGGGFGDPWERDPEHVRNDVLDGRVSREHADNAYGVVIDADMRVDAAATHLRRTAPRVARPAPPAPPAAGI
jgi:N-methylhydantoinase B